MRAGDVGRGLTTAGLEYDQRGVLGMGRDGRLPESDGIDDGLGVDSNCGHIGIAS